MVYPTVHIPKPYLNWYTEKTVVYRKQDCNKYGPCGIAEVFTNGTVRVQKGQVNERLTPDEKADWCPLGTLKI